MAEQESHKTEPMEGKFKIGDHVKTDAQGVVYFGYVKESRQYEGGGVEYFVDFYTYAQGKTWVVEWRLEKVAEVKDVKPIEPL